MNIVNTNKNICKSNYPFCMLCMSSYKINTISFIKYAHYHFVTRLGFKTSSDFRKFILHFNFIEALWFEILEQQYMHYFDNFWYWLQSNKK